MPYVICRKLWMPPVTSVRTQRSGCCRLALLAGSSRSVCVDCASTAHLEVHSKCLASGVPLRVCDSSTTSRTTSASLIQLELEALGRLIRRGSPSTRKLRPHDQMRRPEKSGEAMVAQQRHSNEPSQLQSLERQWRGWTLHSTRRCHTHAG